MKEFMLLLFDELVKSHQDGWPSKKPSASGGQLDFLQSHLI